MSGALATWSMAAFSGWLPSRLDCAAVIKWQLIPHWLQWTDCRGTEGARGEAWPHQWKCCLQYMCLVVESHYLSVLRPFKTIPSPSPRRQRIQELQEVAILAIHSLWEFHLLRTQLQTDKFWDMHMGASSILAQQVCVASLILSNYPAPRSWYRALLLIMKVLLIA